eukprot:2845296-Prymnesium_polylepis.1
MLTWLALVASPTSDERVHLGRAAPDETRRARMRLPLCLAAAHPRPVERQPWRRAHRRARLPEPARRLDAFDWLVPAGGCAQLAADGRLPTLRKPLAHPAVGVMRHHGGEHHVRQRLARRHLATREGDDARMHHLRLQL